jgi:hypothetical protein
MELNKSGSTLTHDKLVLSSGTLTYGGTLNVSVSGDALSGGEVFDLFDAPAFAGSFSTINLPSLPSQTPPLNWYTGDLTVDGTLLVNRAPVANTAQYTRGRGASLKIPISELLANATSDADGHARSLSSVGTPTAPSHGSVSMGGGWIFYTPTDEVSDSFSYAISDGHGGTATGTIQVNVAEAATGTVTISHTGGGAVTLRFYGIPGYEYVIQRSCGSLTNWADLYGPITAATNGTVGLVEYTDTPGVSCDPAYYRVRQY